MGFLVPKQQWGFSFSDELDRLGRGRWVSIDEEMPSCTNECDIKFEGGYTMKAFYYGDRGWATSQLVYPDTFNLVNPIHPANGKITHWRYRNQGGF